MDELLKIKEQLVEEIGLYFEKAHQLPPLAARIYGWLVICPKSGHSFDDIVELSKSSKSSVSTNLNLLLQSGCIEYFTKSGERKRYFRLSKDYLKVTLKQYEERVSKELEIVNKISAFNIKHNKKKYKKHQEFGKLFHEYLKTQHKNLRCTINRMNKLEKSIR